MGEVNLQQRQILELIKQLVEAVEQGQTELLDVIINISKEGTTSMTIMIKDTDE